MTGSFNRSAVLAIAGRDLRVVRRSRAVLLPSVIVPVLLLLVPPLVLLTAVDAPSALSDELRLLLARLPPDIPALPDDPAQQAVLLLLVYVFAPLFLLVPILVASVTAADSVVGERERGTLDALLHSPTTDRELFVGKLLAPWLIATVVTLVCAACYGVIANGVLGAYGLPAAFPNRVWVVLVGFVAPGAAGVSLGVIVVISARVKTFQEASQMSGIVVVPIVGMVVAQVAGLFLFDMALLIALGVILWLLTLLLMRFAVGRFRRDRLITGD
ncbi:MAG TPA: ABC transporter permease subunit [Euzebyales bacterium]